MPLYHFDLTHGQNRLPDTDGCALANLRAARAIALRTAGRMIGDLCDDFWQDPDWRMDVTDHDGLILFSLIFSGNQAAAAGTATSG